MFRNKYTLVVTGWRPRDTFGPICITGVDDLQHAYRLFRQYSRTLRNEADFDWFGPVPFGMSTPYRARAYSVVLYRGDSAEITPDDVMFSDYGPYQSGNSPHLVKRS